MFTAGCRQNDNSIVVYTSQDQIYAEQIFQDFTKETGIIVRTVFDNEAVKTVGLANRLLAEKDHPQCDLFWSNEELRTRLLAGQNVFRETNGWAAFGYRSRRLVVSPKNSPRIAGQLSIAALTNQNFAGQIALAYPLFGTTATHFLALRQHWGNANWERWCRALKANKPKLVDGNSVVVRFVGQGEVSLGLTDSDDIFNGKREGLAIEALPLDQDSLLIPNTVAIIRGTKHMESAEKLFAYLQSPAVVRKLVEGGALEGESKSSVSTPTLQVDWDKLISEIEPATKTLQDIFVR
ncbi:MAG: extracellular solute-binding protein family 1 [Verrucomicrobiales bacterium]|nr:extracellular solute-binding protein family 1 [Verrucomicrobiales bacterium]